MPLLQIRTAVRREGALFDLRGRRLFARYSEDVEKGGAEWALRHVKTTFHASFKAPTGYYESRVHVSNVSGSHEVTDGGEAGPVYGPWLEGVGSRNATTRFRGYFAFRKAAAALENRIESLGERIFRLRYQNRL